MFRQERKTFSQSLFNLARNILNGLEIELSGKLDHLIGDDGKDIGRYPDEEQDEGAESNYDSPDSLNTGGLDAADYRIQKVGNDNCNDRISHQRTKIIQQVEEGDEACEGQPQTYQPVDCEAFHCSI